jgi:hypothetical protein
MAPALYPLWKKSLMDASADSSITDSATLGPYCVLIDTGVYTYSAAHQFYNPALTTGSPIVGSAQRITPTATSVGGTDGVFDGGDLTYTAVTGASVEALIIYRLNTGANTTWRLMSYYDTAGGGLPVTPNGGNITVTWNASGIFQLSDREAKHDIRQIGALGPLGLYEYRYKEANAPPMVGFMAQEVEKVAPSAVVRRGRYRYVNYQEALRCLKTQFPT